MIRWKFHSRLFIVLLVILPMYNAWAQVNPHVQVVGSEMLDSIIAAEAESHKSNPGMAGYRIQIYSNSDRKAANEIRTRYLQLFPESDAYLIYQQPYFKVRVGDFRTRAEAYPIYRALIKEFDNVLIVPDRIQFPKLNTIKE